MERKVKMMRYNNNKCGQIECGEPKRERYALNLCLETDAFAHFSRALPQFYHKTHLYWESLTRPSHLYGSRYRIHISIHIRAFAHHPQFAHMSVRSFVRLCRETSTRASCERRMRYFQLELRAKSFSA